MIKSNIKDLRQIKVDYSWLFSADIDCFVKFEL